MSSFGPDYHPPVKVELREDGGYSEARLPLNHTDDRGVEQSPSVKFSIPGYDEVHVLFYEDTAYISVFKTPK